MRPRHDAFVAAERFPERPPPVDFEWLHRPLFQRVRKKRVTCAFDDIRPGEVVSVTGRAMPDGQPWLLPLSAGNAVWWRWRAEGPSDSGDGRDRLIDEDDYGQRFWLRNSAGARVLIDGGDADFHVERASRCSVEWHCSDEMRERFQVYLDLYGARAHDHFYGFGGGYAYREIAIPIGAQVTVVGLARLEQDMNASAVSYRGGNTRTVLGPPPDGQVSLRLES